VTPIAPPVWSPEDLDRGRLVAIQLFREERVEEPLEHYLEAFDLYRGVVEELFELTVDLSSMREQATSVLTDGLMLEVVRYLAGPPISTDDLKVLADVASLAAGRLRHDPPMAQRVMEIVMMGLDRGRFPWIAEDRGPTGAERSAATVATAALIASRRVVTRRANESKQGQEDEVETVLADHAGFTRVSTRTIDTLADAPQPGCFCRESLFGERKADLVVTLHDKRVMPIECKVSNSSTNSVKRLNNDAAAKAEAWISLFGTRGVVPTAVLSGVYKRHNLEQAQRSGLTLFWAHDLLGPFVAFLNAAR
jgi:XamI restriction endonuclease